MPGHSVESKFAPPVTLLLARHGDCLNGRPPALVGSSDPPLSPLGQRQARALAQLLAGTPPPALCLCSPLRRCRQTAELALGEGAGQLRIDTELREIDFGQWEGLSFAQAAERDPALARRWADWDGAFAFPGGEAIADFNVRVRGLATRLSEASSPVLIFTHGGIIRALICHFLGLAPRQYVLFDIRPGTLTVLKLFGATGVLTRLNQSVPEGSRWDA